MCYSVVTWPGVLQCESFAYSNGAKVTEQSAAEVKWNRKASGECERPALQIPFTQDGCETKPGPEILISVLRHCRNSSRALGFCGLSPWSRDDTYLATCWIVSQPAQESRLGTTCCSWTHSRHRTRISEFLSQSPLPLLLPMSPKVSGDSNTYLAYYCSDSMWKYIWKVFRNSEVL